MEIIPFESRYAQDFKRLNEAWLEHYFVVEPYDSELLSRCEESIIKPGGFIFFVRIDEQIVGTAAFIYKSKGIYELGKMAVDPAFQGLKLGQQLMQYLLDFAKQQQWSKLILYSNTVLENAIYIYRKVGFKTIPLEKYLPYNRSNIKMELELERSHEN